MFSNITDKLFMKIYLNYSKLVKQKKITDRVLTENDMSFSIFIYNTFYTHLNTLFIDNTLFKTHNKCITHSQIINLSSQIAKKQLTTAD